MNTESSHQAEEIQAELAETPFLQRLPKQGFFEAPEGYFENLSERIHTNLAEATALAEEAPTLSALSKEPFFSTPKGYFEELGGRLQEKIEEQESLAAEAPTLNSLPKEPFFSAPEGYFQQLPTQLFQQIKAADATSVHRRPLWRRSAIIMGMAAALACLLLFRFWQDPPAQSEGDWSEIPTGELLAMVEAEAIPTELLLDVLGEASLNSFEDLQAGNISEEELSEYLEGIDLEELEANWPE